MRDGVQFHAEEAWVILDIFHQYFRIAQRVGSLQLVARIGHFCDQTTHPGVQLKLQQTAVFGRADVFTLNQFQVVRDTRQQEDIWQALMRLLAVASAVSYNAGFWVEFAEKKHA